MSKKKTYRFLPKNRDAFSFPRGGDNMVWKGDTVELSPAAKYFKYLDSTYEGAADGVSCFLEVAHAPEPADEEPEPPEPPEPSKALASAAVAPAAPPAHPADGDADDAVSDRGRVDLTQEPEEEVEPEPELPPPAEPAAWRALHWRKIREMARLTPGGSDIGTKVDAIRHLETRVDPGDVQAAYELVTTDGE